MEGFYSVILKVKFADEQKAINELKNKVNRSEQEHIQYHENDLVKALGHQLVSFEDFIREFLRDQLDGSFTASLTDDNFGVFENHFYCCDSWKLVLLEMFAEISPFIEDDSLITINFNKNKSTYFLKNKKVFFKK